MGGALLGGVCGVWNYSKAADISMEGIKKKIESDQAEKAAIIQDLNTKILDITLIIKKINLKEAIERLNGNNRDLKNKNDELVESNKKLQKDLDMFKGSPVSAINSNPNQLTEAGYAQKIQDLNKYISTKENELKILQNKTAFWEKEKQSLHSEIKNISTLRDAAAHAKDQLERELLAANVTIKKQKSVIIALQSDLHKTIEILGVVCDQQRIMSTRQMPKLKEKILEFDFLSTEGKDLYWKVKGQKENTFFPKNFFE